MKNNTCAAQCAVKEEDGELVSTCLGTTFDGKRGVCSNCYKYLVSIGEIVDGVYPEWLGGKRDENGKLLEAGLIHMTDNQDHTRMRHPDTEEPEELNDEINGSDTATKVYLGVAGCYKGKKLTSLAGYNQNS